TRKLSSSAPMVVGGCPPVRVGRCQASLEERSALWVLVFFCLHLWIGVVGGWYLLVPGPSFLFGGERGWVVDGGARHWRMVGG
ncbi:hypothetical protein LC085_19075, partial [Bacillus tianshenii]|uniref:hypothetical protein n=1 Tax=Sutcliffiella tianshenii TaxID=1463404 RepID=UPI001CD44C84